MPPIRDLMPRLSEDLPHPRQRLTCQACGVQGVPLSRWQEHDRHDQPEVICVVLCHPCATRLIEPHARLRRLLDEHAPFPGAIPLCDQCRQRQGLRCTSPAARANGGAGLALTFPEPTLVHLCRSPRRLSGWHRITSGPVTGCAQREEAPS